MSAGTDFAGPSPMVSNYHTVVDSATGSSSEDLHRASMDYIADLSSVEHGRPCDPQTLFDSLDGTLVRLDGSEWRLEVFSVFTEGGRTWIQLLLDGESSHTLTLKLHNKGAADVIAIVTAWLADLAESSLISSVS